MYHNMHNCSRDIPLSLEVDWDWMSAFPQVVECYLSGKHIAVVPERGTELILFIGCCGKKLNDLFPNLILYRRGTPARM